jgi:phospholipid-binding lipoprotein MlaA
MIKRLRNCMAAVVLTALSSGLACADDMPDPLAGYNKIAFAFNNAAYSMYIKPATKVYDTVVPYSAKQSVHSFVRNIMNVHTVADDLLLGDLKQAGNDFTRVVINSTLGLLGLFDVATPMGFAEGKNDLGKVLYHWGWKDSAYFVIPLIGPSTIRDGLGVLGNYFMTPSAYFKPKWRNRYYVVALIDAHRDNTEYFSLVDVAGVNDYDFVRSTYMQHRIYDLSGVAAPALDDHAGNDALGEPPA